MEDMVFCKFTDTIKAMKVINDTLVVILANGKAFMVDKDGKKSEIAGSIPAQFTENGRISGSTP